MFIQSDARYLPLKDKTVQLVVTSPPYFRLRVYPTGRWVGGDINCTHESAKIKTRGDYGYSEKSSKQATNIGASFQSHYQSSCECGAEFIDLQIGQESSIKEYVDNIVQVSREIHRVLKKDGAFFINIGDSRSGSMKGYQKNGTWVPRDDCKQGTNVGSLGVLPTKFDDIEDKNLLLIPHRVAIALIDDGWILRNSIVWEKPNSFCSSATDRFTDSYEMFFFFVKNKKYEFEQQKELAVSTHPSGNGFGRPERQSLLDKNGPRGNPKPWQPTEYRNKRDVWRINAKGYEGHHAVMPEALVETPILACSKVGDIVCDPMSGSGTVGAVAHRLGRKYVCMDLKYDYLKIADERICPYRLGGLKA